MNLIVSRSLYPFDVGGILENKFTKLCPPFVVYNKTLYPASQPVDELNQYWALSSWAPEKASLNSVQFVPVFVDFAMIGTNG